MPEQLTTSPRPETEHPPVPPTPRDGVRRWRVPALQAAAILVLFLAAGLAGGFLLNAVWTPPDGLVYQETWQRGLSSVDPLIFDSTAEQGVFAGIGWYVVIAAGFGLILGAVSSVWLARSELVTLVAVAGGAALGGWVMYAVAEAAAPTDPTTLAGPATDGSILPDTLHLPSAWIALTMPAAALLALTAIFLLFSTRRHGRHAGAV